MPTDWAATLRLAGAAIAVRIEDVTPRGARLVGTGQVPAGRDAVVQIAFGAREVTCQVGIRWVDARGRGAVGVEFQGQTPESLFAFRGLTWKALAQELERTPSRDAFFKTAEAMRSLETALQSDVGLVSPALLELLADEAECLARVARLAAARRPATDPVEPVPASAERPRVVLIDDDASSLAALAELLADDFDVAAAGDALTGLQLARRPPVADAVVTDLEMPGLRGMDVLRLLAADSVTAEVPCILLTAASATRDKVEAFGRGAADYVTKPVDVPELVARLRHHIAEARRRRAERTLQETDALTGLANRRALERALVEAILRARARGTPLALILFDVDGLKRINDGHGHAAGDRALRGIAEALAQAKRGDDLACRLGGDEYAMLLPDTDARGAERLAARIDEHLAAHPLRLGEVTVPLSASPGVASLEADDDGAGAALLARADAAMYACKAARRTQRAS